MKITTSSTIKSTFQDVAEGFNEELFRFLLPPENIAKLIRYDGEKPGSIVHIRFYFPWKSNWISKVTESEKHANEYIFIDKGLDLPFGLKHWKHQHKLIKINNESTLIVDEIDFSTGYKLLNYIIYPFLYFSFEPRKKLYKKYFENKSFAPSLKKRGQLNTI